MLAYYLNMVETPEEKNKVEQLYHKYRNLMKYIALKMLHDEETAEDAVGDALISLIENLDRIGDVDSADTKSFVYIVIRYTALNSYNKSKRHATVNIDDFSDYKVDERDAFEDVYLNDWFVKIRELPAKYRDVLQLRVYYEMSNAEIAKLLCISEDLVRKRLERARKMLREAMERGEETNEKNRNNSSNHSSNHCDLTYFIIPCQDPIQRRRYGGI